MRSPLPLVVGACLAFALSSSTISAGVGLQPMPLLPSKNPARIAPPVSPHGFFVRAGGGVEFPVGGEFTSDLNRCVWSIPVRIFGEYHF